MKVRILDKRMPRRVGEVGEVVDLPERYARAWLRRGLVELPDGSDIPTAEDLGDLTVAELKERADAAELDVARGDGKDGDPLKADYIRALSGRYNRRDMRAE